MTVGVLVILALTIWAAVSVFRYARRQVAAAEKLRQAGWRQVGFNFITGPIMAPPFNRDAQ